MSAIRLEGSALRNALASGTLTSARIDLEELDTSAVENCHPTSTLPSALTLEFIDTHSDDGPESPGGPFPWLTATFPIASDATDVPPGWVLNAPPELNYTWQD